MLLDFVEGCDLFGPCLEVGQFDDEKRATPPKIHLFGGKELRTLNP